MICNKKKSCNRLGSSKGGCMNHTAGSKRLIEFAEAKTHETGLYFLLLSYDKLLLRDSAHLHQNDTSQRRVGTHFWRRCQRMPKHQKFN